MNRLEELRALNPQIHIYSVEDPEFLRYGRVIDEDTTEMCEMVKKSVEMPETGGRYLAALEPIDTMDKAEEYRRKYVAQMDEQWGLVWGKNSTMNALEWHTCNEFNIGVTDLVLILAKRCDMVNNTLDSSLVKAFYVPEGVMIEVYSDTMHFTPCRAGEEGFMSVVGLQRGTTLPLDEDPEKSPLMMSRNKWMICHEESEVQRARGAVPGIYGVNWEITPIPAK